MNPNQSDPRTTKNTNLENTDFPDDEAGATTFFEPDGDAAFTSDGPKGPHIVPQDEFWDGVKNADQTPREVASAVPTDVPEPEMTPEEEMNASK